MYYICSVNLLRRSIFSTAVSFGDFIWKAGQKKPNLVANCTSPKIFRVSFTLYLASLEAKTRV